MFRLSSNKSPEVGLSGLSSPLVIVSVLKSIFVWLTCCYLGFVFLFLFSYNIIFHLFTYKFLIEYRCRQFRPPQIKTKKGRKKRKAKKKKRHLCSSDRQINLRLKFQIQKAESRCRQWRRNEAPACLLMETDLLLQAAKSGRASNYTCLFLCIGFVVGGIFSKILAVNGMSVSVFHFLGEFSSFLILQKYFGRSEKKLPQEL